MTFAINAISASSSTLTMSSREIAELTGKRHDHVIRDIREMMEALEWDAPNLGDVFEDKDSRGYTACFNLPKDLTITLISGYNVKMRHAITKRWMELEAATAPALPTSFKEALLLAAKLEEERELLALENSKQAEVIAEQTPKVNYYDALVSRESTFTPTQVAAALNMEDYCSAAKVNVLLSELGWQFKKLCQNKKNFKWQPTAEAVGQGYLTARSFINEATGYTKPQLLVTTEGLNYLRKFLKL